MSKPRCTECGRDITREGSGLFARSAFCSELCSWRKWCGESEYPHALQEACLSRMTQPQRGRAAIEWANGERAGLILFGRQSGAGKSMAGSLAMRALIPPSFGYDDDARGSQPRCCLAGIFLNAVRLKTQYLSMCRAGAHAERAAWLRQLCQTPALFLDDFDKAGASEGLAEVLFGILDERLQVGDANARTILTTNCCGSELVERLGDTYGPPIVRRIGDYCLDLDFDACPNVISLPTAEGRTADRTNHQHSA